mmetsp:Transcript_4133/g.18724  ORF Transcript_4133/g.18724 Transcript_4133/m.18724 type:complete len:286 (+) Transcript_4133:658-1515(+)
MQQGAARRLHRRASQAPAAGQGQQVPRALLRPRDGGPGDAHSRRGGVRRRGGAGQHRLAHLPRRVPQPLRERRVRRQGPPRGVPRIVPLPRGDFRAALRHLLAPQDVRGVLHAHPALLPHGHRRARGARGRGTHSGDPRAHALAHPHVPRGTHEHHHLRHSRFAGAVLFRRQHHAVLRDGHPAAVAGDRRAPRQGRRRDRLPRRGRDEAVPHLLRGVRGGCLHQGAAGRQATRDAEGGRAGGEARRHRGRPGAVGGYPDRVPEAALEAGCGQGERVRHARRLPGE